MLRHCWGLPDLPLFGTKPPKWELPKGELSLGYCVERKGEGTPERVFVKLWLQSCRKHGAGPRALTQPPAAAQASLPPLWLQVHQGSQGTAGTVGDISRAIWLLKHTALASRASHPKSVNERLWVLKATSYRGCRWQVKWSGETKHSTL